MQCPILREVCCSGTGTTSALPTNKLYTLFGVKLLSTSVRIAINNRVVTPASYVKSRSKIDFANTLFLVRQTLTYQSGLSASLDPCPIHPQPNKSEDTILYRTILWRHEAELATPHEAGADALSVLPSCESSWPQTFPASCLRLVLRQEWI